MKIQKILCPIDFSDGNHFANSVASELAQQCASSIVYLSIARQGTADYGYAMQRTVDRTMAKLQLYQPTHSDVPCEHHVVVCDATGKSIVSFANENHCDLIVMATTGRSGVGRVLLGSVAETVLRNSDCPVLTISPNSRASVPNTHISESSQRQPKQQEKA